MFVSISCVGHGHGYEDGHEHDMGVNIKSDFIRRLIFVLILSRGHCSYVPGTQLKLNKDFLVRRQYCLI